jgi:hypothetical protein
MVPAVSPAFLLAAGLLLAPDASDPRGNTVLGRDLRKPVYSLSAAARLGVLAGPGAELIQPVGFGFALQFRFHGLAIGPTRLGVEAHAGHLRFMERRVVLATDEAGNEQRVRRWAALGHTDFALGPSLQIPVRPLILGLGVGGGLAISHFVRPLGPDVTDEEDTSDVSAMIRAGGQVAVPVRRNQGIALGAAYWQIFSRTQVLADPLEAAPDAEPDTSPFDLAVEVYLSYQMWF